jgi:MFS family permease
MVEPSRYRWVVLTAATIILAVTMGQLVNGLSVYFVPLETSQGWLRGDIALINTAGLVGLAIGSIIMGFATERYGVRPIAVMGVIVTGVAVLVASQADALWQFYVLFFLAGVFGGGALSAPLMALVGNWFPLAAGLAIGIASAGQAFGQGGVPFSGAFLIEAFGWRGAMAAQGTITLVLLLPLTMVLKSAPRSSTSEVQSHQTPSGLPNWLITAWISTAVVFCCICMAVPLMHLVPLMQGKGFSAPDAGGVLFLMLMVAILGRVAFGKLADIVGPIPAYLTASGWQTVLVFGFILMSSLESHYIYAAIYGFGYAGVMTTVLVTARSLAAPARRASTMGIVLAFGYIGHGIGGWQGGFFFDLTGAYTLTYSNAAAAGVINLLIVGALWLTINRRPRIAMAA